MALQPLRTRQFRRCPRSGVDHSSRLISSAYTDQTRVLPRSGPAVFPEQKQPRTLRLKSFSCFSFPPRCRMDEFPLTGTLFWPFVCCGVKPGGDERSYPPMTREGAARLPGVGQARRWAAAPGRLPELLPMEASGGTCASAHGFCVLVAWRHHLLSAADSLSRRRGATGRSTWSGLRF